MTDPITTQPACAAQPNIAQTLANLLPEATVLERTESVIHFAVPAGYRLEHHDTEPLQDSPNRAKGTATFSSAESFLAYIKRHATPATVAWCAFNPQTFALSFTAVLDDHRAGRAGWRQHVARFEPDMSAEWKAWKGSDGKSMAQVAFAEWIESHGDDIATANGLPTALQMLEMATNFVAHEEHALKSAVRLQSGGVRLTYIADPDAGTVAQMQLFEKFGIGIPVFHGGPAWSLGARLKYRNQGGKLSFFYELIRPDRVHEAAAREAIDVVKQGLADGVPLFMGRVG